MVGAGEVVTESTLGYAVRGSPRKMLTASTYVGQIPWGKDVEINKSINKIEHRKTSQPSEKEAPQHSWIQTIAQATAARGLGSGAARHAEPGAGHRCPSGANGDIAALEAGQKERLKQKWDPK